MSVTPVLFVDDEEDIRSSFRTRFREQFSVHLASNGREALGQLGGSEPIAVVVTDIRMPEMGGLELLKESRALNPDIGFIMISGHGDSDEIVSAFRLGARNFLRKPYRFAELEQAILEEARRYDVLRERHKEQEGDQAISRYLRGVERLTYELPTNLDWVNPLSNRFADLMRTTNVCDEENRSRVMLGLVEMFTNAVEHGNLDITGVEKQALKASGEAVYQQELLLRMGKPPYRDRKVYVTATIDNEAATFIIQDEGQGFDFSNLPDPTDPENLFKSSGRGILLTRAFSDELSYAGKGNVVTLVKRRTSGKPS